MARINIEDSLYRDARFMQLYIKLQSVEAALGSLVMAWSVAQEFWKKDENGIPKKEWEKRKLNNEIVNCGLAEDHGEFIYMCGSKDQFSWLSQRIEAGRKGGLTSRSKKLPIKERARREGARMLLNKAVSTGQIIKPESCESCGKIIDTQGHHSDYNKPYEVNWLCRKCHNMLHEAIEHRLLSGRYTVVKPSTPTPTPSPSPNNLNKNTIAQNEEKLTNEKSQTVRVNPHCQFDFNAIYQKYPRKIGKQKGLAKCRTQIKTKELFTLLERAVNKFSEYHANRQTEAQFIPYFSSFMTTWEDWLDDDVGKAEKLIPVGVKREQSENEEFIRREKERNEKCKS